MKNVFIVFLVLICIGILVACTNGDKVDVKPIENFKIENYLGNWYEIGRFDFKFEKNMKNVRANYSLNEDGSIKVINSGFDYVANKDKKVIGKAKFSTSKQDIGSLKVSFFGPFYSSYTIIALDSEYNYSLVAGENNKLLWILSRTPTIPDKVKENYIQIVQALGYDLTDFVWTVQE